MSNVTHKHVGRPVKIGQRSQQGRETETEMETGDRPETDPRQTRDETRPDRATRERPESDERRATRATRDYTRYSIRLLFARPIEPIGYARRLSPTIRFDDISSLAEVGHSLGLRQSCNFYRALTISIVSVSVFVCYEIRVRDVESNQNGRDQGLRWESTGLAH